MNWKNILRGLFIFAGSSAMGILLCLPWFTDAEIEDLGNGYEFVDDPGAIYGPIIIDCHVRDYRFNDDFIIVKQDSDSYRHEIDVGLMQPISSDIDDRFFYWIINKKDTLSIGPTDYNNFIQKSIELNTQLTF